MAKRVVASDRLMQPIAHFSHGVRVGPVVHLGAAAGVDRSRTCKACRCSTDVISSVNRA